MSLSVSTCIPRAAALEAPVAPPASSPVACDPEVPRRSGHGAVHRTALGIADSQTPNKPCVKMDHFGMDHSWIISCMSFIYIYIYIYCVCISIFKTLRTCGDSSLPLLRPFLPDLALQEVTTHQASPNLEPVPGGNGWRNGWQVENH